MASAKRLGEVQWTKVELGAKGDAPPSPRSGHTITVVGDRAVVFGGCGITPTINGVAGEPAIFNETYFLKLAEPMTWELVDVMGDVPSPRWRHTATLLPDHASVLVFGGLEKGRRFNDTHVFSMPDREWNIKECAGSPPHPRSHHTASLVDFEAEDELSLRCVTSNEFDLRELGPTQKPRRRLARFTLTAARTDALACNGRCCCGGIVRSPSTCSNSSTAHG